jgi:hypothetical protein
LLFASRPGTFVRGISFVTFNDGFDPVSGHPSQDPGVSAAARSAHDALMKHSELQFDFPSFTPPKPPDWLIWLGKLLAPLAPYLGYIAWAVVIAAVVLVLFLVVKTLIARGYLFRRRGTEGPGHPEMEWRPTREAALLLLSDADALAARGQYAEAIHFILLRSIQEIGRHRPSVLRPALTSREIGLLRELPETARKAFVAIAQIVERATFAGREVGEADYLQCRAAYERFAFPDLWTLKAAA